MQSTCCCCREEISDNGKNIFNDELKLLTENHLTDSFLSDNNEESIKSIKLCTGIEIITGHKISKLDVSSTNLCDVCYTKLESYVNFRAQLLQSLQSLLCPQDSASISDLNESSSAGTENSMNLSLKSQFKDCICKSAPSDENTEDKDPSNVNVQKDSQPSIVEEDIINVDDNSFAPDLSILSQEDTNDYLDASKLQNDQENNNLNESDSSNDSVDVNPSNETCPKVQDNDIESEIDVCSGEDDEILELDIQCKKNETVEIESSSESDIEVCDYEPTDKRIKNYKALTPPAIF